MSNIEKRQNRKTPENEPRKSIRWGPKSATIPKDWQFEPIEKRTSDIIYPQRDKPTRFDGNIPWIRIEDLNGVYVSKPNDGERYVSRELVGEMNLRTFPKGSLMCSCSTTMGVCAITTRELLSNQTFAGIVTKKGINTKYLYYVIQKNSEMLDQLAAGSTISYLPSDKLANFHVQLPPLPEQRKIASVLYTVDQAIQKTEAIIEKTRRLRRKYIDEVCRSGYYQHDEQESVRVGPREVVIPSSWDLVTLESLTSLITKGQTPTSHGFEYLESGINFVKAESIDEDGRLIEDKFAHVGKKADQKLSRSRLNHGDVLFSIAGALGKVTQVRKRYLPANINQALALIRCDDERVDRRFIRYYLESKTIQKYIQSIATVTAQPNLSLKQVSEFSVLLPPLKEQRAIAQACEHFDNGIRSEEKQFRQLKRLKKGLMQDLLTGEVRTADKAIEVLDEVAAHG